MYQNFEKLLWISYQRLFWTSSNRIDSRTLDCLRFCSNITRPGPTAFHLTLSKAETTPITNGKENLVYSAAYDTTETWPITTINLKNFKSRNQNTYLWMFAQCSQWKRTRWSRIHQLIGDNIQTIDHFKNKCCHKTCNYFEWRRLPFSATKTFFVESTSELNYVCWKFHPNSKHFYVKEKPHAARVLQDQKIWNKNA